MSKKGPIILVDDDPDDQEIFGDILVGIGVSNPLVAFSWADDAFRYLKETTSQPMIIFCDVNLPVLSGIDFKRKIDADPELRKKSIPFVFYSTSADQRAVNEAYTQMTVQGFFQKPATVETFKKELRLILDYWFLCRHPNAG